MSAEVIGKSGGTVAPLFPLINAMENQLFVPEKSVKISTVLL
jgi:hypothetical protein